MQSYMHGSKCNTQYQNESLGDLDTEDHNSKSFLVDDIIRDVIFKFLEPRELCNARLVNKQWNRCSLALDNAPIWQSACLEMKLLPHRLFTDSITARELLIQEKKVRVSDGRRCWSLAGVGCVTLLCIGLSVVTAILILLLEIKDKYELVCGDQLGRPGRGGGCGPREVKDRLDQKKYWSHVGIVTCCFGACAIAIIACIFGRCLSKPLRPNEANIRHLI